MRSVDIGQSNANVYHETGTSTDSIKCTYLMNIGLYLGGLVRKIAITSSTPTNGPAKQSHRLAVCRFKMFVYVFGQELNWNICTQVEKFSAWIEGLSTFMLALHMMTKLHHQLCHDWAVSLLLAI